MLIGGHVSSAGGIEKAPERAAMIGANVLQCFASSPRSFKPNQYTQSQLQHCRENAKKFGIARIFFHGVYLINLAHHKADYIQTSIQSVLQYLAISDAIGGYGVIFHPGFMGDHAPAHALALLIDGVQTILAQIPASQHLLIENSAGQSGSLCASLEDLAIIANAVKNPQLQFCLDTQHAFAQGYDLRTPQAVEQFALTFEQLLGFQRLGAIHCNDSKTELGSHRDRHENIGEGKMGNEAFKSLLQHPKFRDLPFILEVPGFDGKSGPDKANIDRLRKLAASTG